MRALSEKLYGRKYLGFCFIVPVFATLIIYVSMGLWPLGDGSVLVLDLNAQYIYYFEKLRSIITGGGSLLYTFGRALGGEFMGIFAYYLSSPFSLVVALFPKSMMTEAILTMILLKAGAAGLTFGIFIHHLKGRRPAATVAFSVMWSLSAFCVVMQSNLMWTDCIVWLPLVLIGVDGIIQKGKFKTFVIFLSLSILSSFYIGYMVCLFIGFYFFVRYFSLTKEERNPNGDGEAVNFFRALGRTALFSVISVMIAAIVILPAYYSLSFGKLEFSTPNWEPKQIFNFLPLLSKFFFGSYDTVRPEGMPFLYCGMMVPLLLPLYFLAKDIKPRKKIAAGLIILFFFAGFNFNVFDIIWHGFQRPNWLNARFAFIFVFFILVMAYDAFIRLDKIGYGKVIGAAGAVTLLLFVLQAQGLENMPDFLCVWASFGLIGVYCAVMYFTRSAASPSLTVPGIVLAVIVSTEMILSGVANAYALDSDVVFSRRSSYRDFIDRYEEAVKTVDDEGFYRSEKLEHRKTNDNFALGLNGLSNSTSTLNSDVIRLLRQFGLTSRSHWSKYCGATATEDIFFGVKYVYVDTEKTTLPHYLAFYYDKISETDGGISVFENPYALSPVFAAPDAMRDFEIGDDALTDPFDLMNRLYGALTDEPDRDPIYVKAQLLNMDWDDLSKFGVKDHDGFEKRGDDPSVTFTVKVTQSGVLYMYIPSTYPRDCKLYVNGALKGKYFTNDTLCITELGSFDEGEEVTVRLECESDKLYIGYGIDYFYVFDEEAFVDTLDDLKCTSFESSSFRDDRIEGTLTVPEGEERIMTTIPYDEGWIITANGERVSYEKTLGALIAFDLPAGEYDIVMKYSPSCVKIGAAISAGGVLLFAGACVLTALRKKKKTAASAVGAAVEVPPEDSDLIFGNPETAGTPDTKCDTAGCPDETNTIPDEDDVPPDEEDNEEETT